MNIRDPRTDTEISVEDMELKQKKNEKTKKIDLSESLEVSWSEDTEYEHLSPTVLVIMSVTPFLTYLLPVFLILSTGGEIPTIVAGMTGVIGLFSIGLFFYGIYRFENPEYKFPEHGTVHIKSNGVKIDIYTPDPEKLMNQLS